MVAVSSFFAVYRELESRGRKMVVIYHLCENSSCSMWITQSIANDELSGVDMLEFLYL